MTAAEFVSPIYTPADIAGYAALFDWQPLTKSAHRFTDDEPDVDQIAPFTAQLDVDNRAYAVDKCRNGMEIVYVPFPPADFVQRLKSPRPTTMRAASRADIDRIVARPVSPARDEIHYRELALAVNRHTDELVTLRHLIGELRERPDMPVALSDGDGIDYTPDPETTGTVAERPAVEPETVATSAPSATRSGPRSGPRVAIDLKKWVDTLTVAHRKRNISFQQLLADIGFRKGANRMSTWRNVLRAGKKSTARIPAAVVPDVERVLGVTIDSLRPGIAEDDRLAR